MSGRQRAGLKRPVTVSDRKGSGRYELVCGQGRIDAAAALVPLRIKNFRLSIPKQRDIEWIAQLGELIARP